MNKVRRAVVDECGNHADNCNPDKEESQLQTGSGALTEAAGDQILFGGRK